MKPIVVRGVKIESDKLYYAGIAQYLGRVFGTFKEYEGKVEGLKDGKLLITDGIENSVFESFLGFGVIRKPEGLFEKVEIPLEQIVYFRERPG